MGTENIEYSPTKVGDIQGARWLTAIFTALLALSPTIPGFILTSIFLYFNFTGAANILHEEKMEDIAAGDFALDLFCVAIVLYGSAYLAWQHIPFFPLQLAVSVFSFVATGYYLYQNYPGFDNIAYSLLGINLVPEEALDKSTIEIAFHSTATILASLFILSVLILAGSTVLTSSHFLLNVTLKASSSEIAKTILGFIRGSNIPLYAMRHKAYQSTVLLSLASAAFTPKTVYTRKHSETYAVEP